MKFTLAEGARPESAQTEGEAARGVRRRAQVRILVVDDEPTARKTAVLMLERLGYRAVAVADGAEAVERFEREPEGFDLVLLDMVMPRMGGRACFERLRAIRPRVRALLSSGYETEAEIQATLAAGAAGFLPKPYQLVELNEAVRRALG